MKKPFNELRIIFIGTPDFAVASLDALVKAGANIVAVITVPDKPAGRGMTLQASAVKQYALQNNLVVLQPVKLKSHEFIEELKGFKADLQVVVAFRMLPVAVWDMPTMGTINVHASLLPQYRGAAPINWAIINGETETGVTTFKLKHEIDTGDILLQQKITISPDDNAGSLHDKLMIAGANLLVETIQRLAEGAIEEIPQNSVTASEIKHAPKLFKPHMQINWDQPAENTHNLIRGLSPYPAAFTLLGEKSIKVFRSHFENAAQSETPGTYQVLQSPAGKSMDTLRFAANDGWVYIEELQQEGKKRMGIVEFLRGFR